MMLDESKWMIFCPLSQDSDIMGFFHSTGADVTIETAKRSFLHIPNNVKMHQRNFFGGFSFQRWK
jgi:hypothetical protein